MTFEFLARLRTTIDELRSDRRRRNGWISMASGISLLVVAAVLGTAMALRVDNATSLVEHTYQVRGLVDRINIGLQDAEIAARDGLLEGENPEALQAYK